MSADDSVTLDIRIDITAFQEALREYIETVAALARDFDAFMQATGREYPHRSAMHAAYRAKTRRRNRR